MLEVTLLSLLKTNNVIVTLCRVDCKRQKISQTKGQYDKLMSQSLWCLLHCYELQIKLAHLAFCCTSMW